MKVTAVIMAAGKSKRMKSALPKVLHPILGVAMIEYSIDAVKAVSAGLPVVIIGHGGEKVKQAVGKNARFVVQKEQLGTAHAVQQTRHILEGKTDLVVVISADMPLLRSQTIKQLLDLQIQNNGPLSLISLIGDSSHGFGRVVRDDSGNILGVVEEKVATTEQLEIREYNASVYCFRASWLWNALEKVDRSPVGEYYLTDLVSIVVSEKKQVQAMVLEDTDEAIGINNRIHFAEAEKIMRCRVNQELMLNGVTMVDPDRVYIHKKIKIGRDTIIFPEVYLRGNTMIGEGCRIGPGVVINDSQVGNRCRILSSVLEGAVLEDDVEMGPYCHLRKGAHLANGVHMGNFGEVKNSYLAAGVKMGHFSYIGDATIGKNVNIGAGTITCNYDGEKKNHTEIGEGAFIGSDTMLVAPVKIGKGAKTGAGAVVTKDVPDNVTVVGMPAKPIKERKRMTKGKNTGGEKR
jgi:bifunctional UDP-N-acetylglucosamine pyrophosphorylase/glucosamine-1-phosphate N-acetyltransferase